MENQQENDNYEQELASKTLHIQSKRFYLDVKQNSRGRFMKIAEVGTGGRKSRLLMAMSTAEEFMNNLTEFAEFYKGLGPVAETSDNNEDGRLKSAVISKDVRRYYLDLKENSRGRFLRVAQTMSQGPRSQVAIPAQGIVEFRDMIQELLNEFGVEDFESSQNLPDNKSIRVDNKLFYFDVGTNRRGVFLRVSEVRTHVRTSITIPEKAWSQIRDVMDEYVEFAKKEGFDTGAGEEQPVVKTEKK